MDKENDDKELELYKKNKKLIRAVARRYSKIDPAIEEEDLMNEAYFAIREALENFKEDMSELSFSSYLWWYLQKRFQSILKEDKAVELKINGEKKIISFNEFLRVKRTLPKGYEWRVISLTAHGEYNEEIKGED